MLISYSKKFNIRILRKICKIKCIKFVSQLNKLKLIKILIEFTKYSNIGLNCIKI